LEANGRSVAITTAEHDDRFTILYDYQHNYLDLDPTYKDAYDLRCCADVRLNDNDLRMMST